MPTVLPFALTFRSQCDVVNFGKKAQAAILNNLHSVITSNPVIMFYPGSYNGQSFKLFNKLENDNYYRAFQFVGRK